MEKMNSLIKKLDVDGLEELWIKANKEQGSHVFMIRGLVMDKLEELNPNEFDSWIDSDAPEPDFSKFK